MTTPEHHGIHGRPISHRGECGLTHSSSKSSTLSRALRCTAAGCRKLASKVFYSLHGLAFRQVAAGGQKHVLKPEEKEPLDVCEIIKPHCRIPASTANKVYYIPKEYLGGLFSTKEELRKELETIEAIRDAYASQNDGDFPENLALNVTEIKGEGRIGKRYTLEAEAAKGDFETELNHQTLNDDQIRSLSHQFLNGFAQLHQTGFCYGDVKPENCLIFEDPATKQLTLKVTDFGRAVRVSYGESKPYKGNLRFAPPEGTASEKGDVYGAALVLIRTFESKYLENSVLHNTNGIPAVKIEPSQQEPLPALEKRKGLEQLIFNHTAFPAIEALSLKDKLYRYFFRANKLQKASDEQKKNQNEILKSYIGILCQRMRNDPVYSSNPQAVNQFRDLLVRMVSTDPSKRPSMLKAALDYENIFSSSSHSEI